MTRMAYLPCGTDVTDLIEQVAEHGPGTRTPHQATCEACQQALSELGRRWSAVRQLRDEPAAAPPGLADRIMLRVRASVRDEDEWVGFPSERGVTEIPTRVLGMIAYWAAHRSDAVLEVPLARATRRESGSLVTIELELEVAYGASLPGVTAEVRHAVRGAVTSLCGMVAPVDILVVDVIVRAANPFSS